MTTNAELDAALSAASESKGGVCRDRYRHLRSFAIGTETWRSSTDALQVSNNGSRWGKVMTIYSRIVRVVVVAASVWVLGACSMATSIQRDALDYNAGVANYNDQMLI